MEINKFVKDKRVATGLTQPELAEKAGVGLRFVRDLEQGKQTLRLDKVNQVLQLFGFQLGPVEIKRGDIAESVDIKDHVNAEGTRKKEKS
jgi:y4mF family transcriptional regulator